MRQLITNNMANPKKDKATTPPPAPTPGPMSFREILGQEWVVSHLKSAREKGRLAHAYLFVGPEGVGKASVARALAAALNCLTPLEDGDACGSLRLLPAAGGWDPARFRGDHSHSRSPSKTPAPDQDRADPGVPPPHQLSASRRRLAGGPDQARRKP